MKILVVDDSKTARYLAVKTLQDLGYKHVTEVTSAEDALVRMKSESFDLVLLDWNMEGMTGLDCLKQIRSNPKTDKVFVIMVTTVNEKKNVIQAVKVGIQGYFFKPITASVIKSKMKELEEKLIGEPRPAQAKDSSPAPNSEHSDSEPTTPIPDMASALEPSHSTDYLAEKS